MKWLSAGYFTCFSSAASTFFATAAGTCRRSGYWLQAFCVASWLITPSTVAGPFDVNDDSIIWRTSASVTLTGLSALAPLAAVCACAPDAASSTSAAAAIVWSVFILFCSGAQRFMFGPSYVPPLAFFARNIVRAVITSEP